MSTSHETAGRKSGAGDGTNTLDRAAQYDRRCVFSRGTVTGRPPPPHRAATAAAGGAGSGSVTGLQRVPERLDHRNEPPQ